MLAPASTSTNSRGETIVKNTIIVTGVFDGKGKTYVADRSLGSGGQEEGQKPLFKIMNGGTIKNVVIDKNGADGIHTEGNATVENVVWKDVGEDALTVKKPGNVTIRGGSAAKATDKIFQLNAPGKFTVSNFKATDFGTFIRTNGGKNIASDIQLNNVTLTNGTHGVRVDRNAKVRGTNVRMTNVKTPYRVVNQKFDKIPG